MQDFPFAKATSEQRSSVNRLNSLSFTIWLDQASKLRDVKRERQECWRESLSLERHVDGSLVVSF
jgi:hypothetical protein